MTHYIQGPAKGKAAMLENLGATRLGVDDTLLDIGTGYVLVCVVDNGPFEAAAIVDFLAGHPADFAGLHDYRPKTWLSLPRELLDSLEIS